MSRQVAKQWMTRIFFGGFALLVFGLVVTLATWLTIKTKIQGRVVTTPDLVGYSVDEAKREVERLGLIFQIDEGKKVYSNVVPADQVYLQTPRPDRKIKAGRILEVTLSAGPEEKRIPDLSEETLAFSQTLLRGVGKQVDILSRSPSQAMPKGRVIDQHPEPGADPELPRRTALLISDGEQSPWYVTPELTGKDFAAVKAFLDRHNFRTITKYQSADPQLGPVVLRQLPEAGYPINKSQTITLVVNKDF